MCSLLPSSVSSLLIYCIEWAKRGGLTPTCVKYEHNCEMWQIWVYLQGGTFIWTVHLAHLSLSEVSHLETCPKSVQDKLFFVRSKPLSPNPTPTPHWFFWAKSQKQPSFPTAECMRGEFENAGPVMISANHSALYPELSHLSAAPSVQTRKWNK